MDYMDYKVLIRLIGIGFAHFTILIALKTISKNN